MLFQHHGGGEDACLDFKWPLPDLFLKIAPELKGNCILLPQHIENIL